jgi:hypothetical protein
MLKSLLRDRWLLFLLILSILVKLFSLNDYWVERYYTHGFYPAFSMILRSILGWIPFSIGDILYLLAFVYLVMKTWKFLRILAKRQVKEYLSWILFRKYLKLILGIYLVFNIFWGLNYNRQGIAGQLELNVKPYSSQELYTLTSLLLQRLNGYAESIDSVNRMRWDKNNLLFRQGVHDYSRAKKRYSFLEYKMASIKPSLYSPVGHYFGFSGYFNPFSGEAQMNTSEPVFVKPFVLNHEIAHQLGYGKENEASFISFLVTKESSSIDFRYSVYYELFYNALSELRMNKDTVATKTFISQLHSRVRLDKREEIKFRSKRRNKMQPYVSDFYDNYLKVNNQPGGLATYNEVTAWLIAFMKKYGVEEI